MSKPKPTQSQQRTTVVYAVATFAALAVITLVAWSFNRSKAPESAAQPAAPMSAEMAQASAPQAAEQHEHTFERISMDDFRKALDAKAVTVIDVRDIEQYGASHIPGSLHIPVSRIEGEIPYLPKDKPIVTYCSCPAEESSGHAAMILANGGLQAKALTGGFDVWVAQKYPTASGLQ